MASVLYQTKVKVLKYESQARKKIRFKNCAAFELSKLQHKKNFYFSKANYIKKKCLSNIYFIVWANKRKKYEFKCNLILSIYLIQVKYLSYSNFFLSSKTYLFYISEQIFYLMKPKNENQSQQ